MSGGKASPRQKMINMMYLVLTALLALNVSKSILDAFVIVNDSLEITNKSFIEKNARLFVDFEKAKANNPKKVEPYLKRALEAQYMSDSIYNYIQNLKKHLIGKVEGYPFGAPKIPFVNDTLKEEGGHAEENVGELSEESRIMLDSASKFIAAVSNKDNYDIPSHIMIPDPATPTTGLAHQLKNQLIVYKSQMLNLIKDPGLAITNRDKILADLGDLGIFTDVPLNDKADADPSSKNWEGKNFYHAVVVATICILTKIQTDIQNAESQIVTTLLSQVDAGDFKFDVVEGKIIPKSNYVLAGDAYEADMFVAAYSSTQNPIIMIGDGYDTIKGELTGKIDTVKVEHGVGRYSAPASGVGMRKYSALIRLKKPGTDNEYKDYPIPNNEYRVAPPSVVVSPTKMNVLYRGIDNPISVSAAGMSAEDLNAAGANVTLSMTKPGEYIARPGAGNDATISVSAKVEGTSRAMGKADFRVKNVPDPVAKIGGQRGGTIKKGTISSLNQIEAVLENFAFDLTFNVVSFKLVTQSSAGFFVEEPANGSNFNGKQKKIISDAKVGGKLFFEDIKAKGPDGKVRELGAISFKIIP